MLQKNYKILDKILQNFISFIGSETEEIMNFIKNNKKAIVSIVTLASIVFVGEYALASIPKNVELNIDENIKSVDTQAATIKELLEEQGFDLNDISVSQDLNNKVTSNTQLDINTKKDITFSNRGTILNVSTFTNNVADFLKENAINPDEDDLVSPSLTSKLLDNEQIKYDEVVFEDYTLEEEIPFEKKEEHNFHVPYGETKISIEGKNGLQKLYKTKTIVNDKVVEDKTNQAVILEEKIDELKLIGSKEIIRDEYNLDTIVKKNSSMYKDQSKTIQKGKSGIKEYVYANKGDGKRELISENIVKEAKAKIIEVGTKKRPSTSSARIYSLRDLQFHGVINWSGYRFTYYSQRVLPGGGLNIPGRHINSAGFVADKDGYIVLANSAPKGTVINTPFGYKGKVYDRGTYGNHFDVYTR